MSFVISEIRYLSMSLLSGTFLITLNVAKWCKTISKISFTAVSTNTMPIVRVFSHFPINFCILEDTINLLHFIDKFVMSSETTNLYFVCEDEHFADASANHTISLPHKKAFCYKGRKKNTLIVMS